MKNITVTFTKEQAEAIYRRAMEGKGSIESSEAIAIIAQGIMDSERKKNKERLK